MSKLPSSPISLSTAKYINKINNRKNLFVPTQDLTEPFFFVPTNRRKKF